MGKRRNRRNRENKNIFADQGYPPAPASIEAPRYQPPCHKGPKKVLMIGSTAIYAGSQMEMKTNSGWDLLIRIKDNYTFLPVHTTIDMNPTAKALLDPSLASINTPPIMSIEWEDWGSPMLPKEWWVKLYETIKGWEGEKFMGIHCMGGHGRTGTALAILAGLNGNYTETLDPVGYVRLVYCEAAVETAEQISYIEDVTGCKITSKSSFMRKYEATTTSTVKSAENSAAVFDQGYLYSDADQGLDNYNTTGVPYGHMKSYDDFEDDDDGSYTGPNHRKVY